MFLSPIQSQGQTAGQEITRNIPGIRLSGISVLCSGIPQRQWLKDGNVYSNTRLLFIPPVAEDDYHTGFYQCLATTSNEVQPEFDTTGSSQMFYALFQGILISV